MIENGWYVLLNPWLLIFVSAVPVFSNWPLNLLGVLKAKDEDRALALTLWFIQLGLISGFGWLMLSLAVDRYWELRILHLPPDASFDDQLEATADGANRLFTLACGWFVSGIYAAIWVLIIYAMSWIQQFRYGSRSDV